jgi:cyclophilin family peptidyl-prolyl cis-trans isomerase
MGSEKRERQKAGRTVRRAEQDREVRREGRRRRLGLGAVGAVVVIGVLLLLSNRSDDESDPSSTTSAAAPVDITVPEPGASITGETPCPPVDGSAERTTRFENPPPECIDPSADYQATVTTSVGEFTVDLDAAAAPGTVNNFVVLSRYGYFDGVAFHRIIPGFVVQGGDAVGYPQSDLDAPAGATTPGTGNPGYGIPDELPAPTDGGTTYAVGSLAMANSGPDTGGSQWFVVTGAQGESLPADFSLFGSVAEGMDVVTAIEAVGSAGEGAPTAEIVIESITITGP